MTVTLRVSSRYWNCSASSQKSTSYKTTPEILHWKINNLILSIRHINVYISILANLSIWFALTAACRWLLILSCTRPSVHQSVLKSQIWQSLGMENIHGLKAVYPLPPLHVLRQDVVCPIVHDFESLSPVSHHCCLSCCNLFFYLAFC